MRARHGTTTLVVWLTLALGGRAGEAGRRRAARMVAGRARLLRSRRGRRPVVARPVGRVGRGGDGDGDSPCQRRRLQPGRPARRHRAVHVRKALGRRERTSRPDAGSTRGRRLRVAFSPDGKRLVTSEPRPQSADLGRRDGPPPARSRRAAVIPTAEFSPDGKLVVTAGGVGGARIWDARDGRRLHS